MKQNFEVVAVQYQHPQTSGVVTLCAVMGSATAEIPVPAASIGAYRIGRRVTITMVPR